MQADFALGYKVPLYNVKTDRESLVFNPQIYIEAASHNYMQYILGPFKFKFDFEFIPFKFTPFYSQVLDSLEPSENKANMLDFCFGLQYLTDVMDLEILLEVDVLECELGLFGFLIGDNLDCYWKNYPMAMPIVQMHFLNVLDTANPLISWYCNFD